MPNDVSKKDVLNAVRGASEALSATAFSKILGFSKKNARVADLLEELANDDQIAVDDSGGFVKYSSKTVAKKGSSSKDSAPKKDSTPKNESDNVKSEALGSFDPESVRIPVDTHGFKIEDKRNGFQVRFPNGREHFISRQQRILVINMDKKILVEDPEDVLFAIDDYCRKGGITNYILKDLSVGRAVLAQNVDKSPVIIFVQVERHNKAGF